MDPNALKKLQELIAQDLKQNKINSKRVTKNLPHVERKLDIVTSIYSFKMEIPLTSAAQQVTLNLYLKPDNCCECLSGFVPGARKGTGDIVSYEDFIYNQGTPPTVSGLVQSIPGPNSDGIDHRGLIDNFTTTGELDSPWWAYPNYPWFVYREGYKNYWDENRYGDFSLVDQAISVMVNGKYIARFRTHISGITTNTSKITASIKRLRLISDVNTYPAVYADEWETIASKIYSIQKGNICWTYGENRYCADYDEHGSFEMDLDINAICFMLREKDLIAPWIKAEDVYYWNPVGDDFSILLIGMGYGLLRGRVVDAATGLPLEDIPVKLEYDGSTTYTDIDGYYNFQGTLNLSPGWYYVTAGGGSSGYTAQTQRVYVPMDDIANLDFALTHI